MTHICDRKICNHWFRYNDFPLDQHQLLFEPVTNKVNKIKIKAQEIYCYKTAWFYIASVISSWLFFITDGGLIDAAPFLNITLERPDRPRHIVMVAADVLAPNMHNATILTRLWWQCHRNHSRSTPWTNNDTSSTRCLRIHSMKFNGMLI